jgi:hypothetical protein
LRVLFLLLIIWSNNPFAQIHSECDTVVSWVYGEYCPEIHEVCTEIYDSIYQQLTVDEYNLIKSGISAPSNKLISFNRTEKELIIDPVTQRAYGINEFGLEILGLRVGISDLKKTNKIFSKENRLIKVFGPKTQTNYRYKIELEIMGRVEVIDKFSNLIQLNENDSGLLNIKGYFKFDGQGCNSIIDFKKQVLITL